MPIANIDKVISASVKITRCSTTGSVVIKENAENAKLRGVKIVGLEQDCLAFKLDDKNEKNSQISRYINKSQKNVNKGCDGIIATKFGEKYYILVCELKSDNPKGFEEQMKSSHAFLDYIQSLLERFFDSSISEFVRVNVLFSTKVYKMPVSPRKAKPQKLSRNGVEYLHQTCRPGLKYSEIHVSVLL